jgi:hypothetical protein
MALPFHVDPDPKVVFVVAASTPVTGKVTLVLPVVVRVTALAGVVVNAAPVVRAPPVLIAPPRVIVLALLFETPVPPLVGANVPL